MKLDRNNIQVFLQTVLFAVAMFMFAMFLVPTYILAWITASLGTIVESLLDKVEAKEKGSY